MDIPRVRKILARGLALRCPDCGRGRLYRSFFNMKDHCDYCGLIFMREQGYYIGAIYINVIATESLLIAAFLIYYLATADSGETIYTIMFVMAVVLPLSFFRHSRSLWLAIDHIVEPLENRVKIDPESNR
ncbi:MAG TPA: DUF983 domain-containing protein [Blastocatellia bacterium]|nr:DUF983 domain-containing protein [Blastocatellia bacterium]